MAVRGGRVGCVCRAGHPSCLWQESVEGETVHTTRTLLAFQCYQTGLTFAARVRHVLVGAGGVLMVTEALG